MYKLRIVIVFCSFIVAFSSLASLQNQDAKLFAYKDSVPFDAKKVSDKNKDGVVVQEIDYAAHTSERGRMKAYLIQPQGVGPFAGVLFFHWLGEPNGNKEQFVDEAVALAKQGTVSLLIEGYFPWKIEPKDGQTDRKRVIDESIEVRRALDFLLSQPGVDPKRIAYVGHDYGAMYGAIMGGVDKRVKTYILMAPIGSWSDWSLAYWLAKAPENDKEAYRKALEGVDPINYVSRLAPSPILLQFATADEHITKDAATSFADAASEPKQVKWYETKHHLNVEAARNDRSKWLQERLGLAK